MSNDLLDAIKSRLKAPYFGYAILAFFALNWRSIFMLVMTKGTPQERLEAFDSQTNIWLLYVLPITTGFLVTAATPWLQWFFNWFSHKPSEKNAFLSLRTESRQMEEKTKLEKERTIQLENQEKELIARAQRDEEIRALEDTKAQEQLKKDIASLRSIKDHTQSSGLNVLSLSSEEEDILLSASLAQGKIKIDTMPNGPSYLITGISAYGLNSHEESLRYSKALKSLMKSGLVTSKPYGAELTIKGWELAGALQSIAQSKN